MAIPAWLITYTAAGKLKTLKTTSHRCLLITRTAYYAPQINYSVYRNTWVTKDKKTDQNRNKKEFEQKRSSSYPNSVPLVTEPRPAEEPREPGAEFLDEGLGTTGGRWISRSESPILSAVLGSASVLRAISFGKWCNLLLLFGRVDRLREEPDRDLCSSGGSSSWSMNFAKEKKVRERE